MITSDVIESSGNVFADLGFNADEALLLQLRAQVLMKLRTLIAERHWTTQQAAAQLGVESAWLSDVTSHQTDQLSLDTLVTLAIRAGCRVELEVLPV